MRGAGKKKVRDRDRGNRYFIYKMSKKGKQEFPQSEEYMDKLISVALLYGDTFRMAAD